MHFRQGPKVVARELAAYLKRLGVPASRVRRAVAAAYQAQERFRQQVLAAGQRAMDTLVATGEPGIVLVGRPYNVHDAGMNLSLAGKLRDYYGVNVVPLDFLDTDPLDVRDINAAMYWDLGRQNPGRGQDRRRSTPTCTSSTSPTSSAGRTRSSSTSSAPPAASRS